MPEAIQSESLAGTRTRNVAILGSTGSIGRSAIEVVHASQGRLRVAGISANRSLQTLQQQAVRIRPRWVVAVSQDESARFDWGQLPPETELLTGSQGLECLVRQEEVDIVLAAIVGSAGLRGAWAALEAGKPLALANKETLVMAGPLVTRLAAERQTWILPVDSEHSAIFQALQQGRRSDVKRIILTASGGPFRQHTAAQLAHVSVEEALAHPTWEMGKKITIDSATMMNKALEIIEARWLFDLDPQQIQVVIHPQSIVHSLVEYRDGSVMAQMSPPDMKLPIQYALSYPERWESPAKKLDFTRSMRLDFEPPDEDRFPALKLGYEVARLGGTAGAVLNAANEAAVTCFLQGELNFPGIVSACRAVLDHHPYESNPTLDQLIQLDAWAREEVRRWIGC